MPVRNDEGGVCALVRNDRAFSDSLLFFANLWGKEKEKDGLPVERRAVSTEKTRSLSN